MIYRKARNADGGNLQTSSRQAHAVQCMISANSIIAIFDLFRQTFGVKYTILSLGYSVYTAASIFLLEVQATSTPSERLSFCIQALESIKDASPSTP
jgi:hypothetical protein